MMVEKRSCGAEAALPGKGRLLERVLHPAAEKIVAAACENLVPCGEGPVLEILPGPDSPVPRGLAEKGMVGVGGSPGEMAGNTALSGRIRADLNGMPVLPFADRSFSAALLLFGVETLRRPFEVFSEAARVLKPGGIFPVACSSVSDPRLAIAGWERMDREEQLRVVTGCFEQDERFGRITAHGTRKRRRSEASRKKRPARNLPHVWIVHADRAADGTAEKIPWGTLPRRDEADDPCVCPYCGDRLKKWQVPHSPFEIECWYETDHLYICFNDGCPYFRRGWDWMWSRMKRNVSYRHMYNPVARKSGPMPVPTYFALKDGILDEEPSGDGESGSPGHP